MNNKMIIGLGFVSAATVLTIANVDRVDATSALTATVNLNMRSGPSTSYGKIGTVKQGESVQSISQSNGWYKVKTKYGTTGWVTGQYLTNSTINNNTNHNTTTNTQVKGRTLSNLIVVNRTYHTLKYYVNGQVVYSTSCSVGKYSSPTPTGKYSVINKIVNRPYYKKNIPGGDPKNPLGNRWLGLSIGSG